MSKPVVVYGASGYTGRLVCEYLREYNVPFIAAGRDKARMPGRDGQRPRHRDRRPRDRRGRARRRGADRAVRRRAGRLQHRRPVRQVRPRGRRGLPRRRLPLPGHHRRAGLADHLRRRSTAQRVRRRRACCSRPGIAQMYTTGEIAAQLCLETPGLDTLDILVFWKGTPTVASTQTILVNAATGQGLLPGAEPVRGVAGRRRPVRRRDPGPARDRRWRCRGAAPRTRCGSSTTRAWPTSRCWAACSTAR